VQTNDKKLRVGDGAEIWAQRSGAEGATVLLLTGATLQATAWEPSFTDVLHSAGFSTIRFDWRDVGLSTWRRYRDHPYTASTLAEDSVAVLDAFGASASHVVGFSMGGIIAQLIAAVYPTRVKSLTLMASGFASARGEQIQESPRSSELFTVLALPHPETRSDQVERLVDQWRHLCGRAWSFDVNEWKHRAERWVERGQNWSCPHLRLWPTIVAKDREQTFANLHIPTLVIHGDDEAMFSLEHGQAISAAFSDAELVVLEGRGHEIHLDPDIAATVATFLRSID
jgi:pimeloyl-ACP methyl ester carboxylesterase